MKKVFVFLVLISLSFFSTGPLYAPPDDVNTVTQLLRSSNPGDLEQGLAMIANGTVDKRFLLELQPILESDLAFSNSEADLALMQQIYPALRALRKAYDIETIFFLLQQIKGTIHWQEFSKIIHADDAGAKVLALIHANRDKYGRFADPLLEAAAHTPAKHSAVAIAILLHTLADGMKIGNHADIDALEKIPSAFKKSGYSKEQLLKLRATILASIEKFSYPHDNDYFSDLDASLILLKMAYDFYGKDDSFLQMAREKFAKQRKRFSAIDLNAWLSTISQLSGGKAIPPGYDIKAVEKLEELVLLKMLGNGTAQGHGKSAADLIAKMELDHIGEELEKILSIRGHDEFKEVIVVALSQSQEAGVPAVIQSHPKCRAILEGFSRRQQ